MSEFKQVLILRQTFPDAQGVARKLRTGKYIAQAAHASITAILENFITDGKLDYKGCDEWFDLKNHQAKIAVYVKDEAELFAIHEAAKTAGLPTSLIQDSGHTEFAGVPTYTAVAVGPASKEEVNKITGHLPLL